MANQDFTLTDIKDFLLEELDLIWYGEILDRTLNGGQYRKAKMSDFEILQSLRFQVKEKQSKMMSVGKVEYYELGDVSIIVFDDTFTLPHSIDCSAKWKSFKEKRKETNLSV